MNKQPWTLKRIIFWAVIVIVACGISYVVIGATADRDSDRINDYFAANCPEATDITIGTDDSQAGPKYYMSVAKLTGVTWRMPNGKKLEEKFSVVTDEILANIKQQCQENSR